MEREGGEEEEEDGMMRGIPGRFTKMIDLLSDPIIPSSNTYQILLVFSSSSSPSYHFSLLSYDIHSARSRFV